MRIHYQGLLRSSASWAHVGRELLLALDRAGHEVSVTSCKGFLYEPDFAVHDRLRTLMDRPRHTDYELAIEYPGNYHHLTGDKRVAILFYESSELPPHWKKPILSHLDRLVVPSSYCRDIMTTAGIPETMVTVVPYGVNQEVFHPQVSPALLDERERFVFLHMAAPHLRKGTRELIRAYFQAFTADDPVLLVLKSTYMPTGRPWETVAFARIVSEEAGAARRPDIKIIISREPETRVAGMLAGCGCYVQPSYSEGFGLVIPQAMACGTPVITCANSAMTDYCTDENAVLVGSRPVPAGPMQYDYMQGKGIVHQPDVDELAKAMRMVYEDVGLREKLVARGAATARQLTWDNTARLLAQCLQGI